MLKKVFNITGLCVKDRHYMVDTTEKIRKIIKMVERGDYFTINRPRQFGKTTTLHSLKQALSDQYLVVESSFEGVGDNFFKSEENFCGKVLKILGDSMRFIDKETSQLLYKYSSAKSFDELSHSITEFIIETGRQVVLLIDEVDKNSNSRVFLQFLGLLRNKYLSAVAKKDITFQSVILAGVHDVRTLKLALRDENEVKFNSPWNIAAKFDIDMSFNAREIATMLVEYQKETGKTFDTTAIAELLYRFTSGYPYLVSDICKTVDEKHGDVWTDQSIYMAVKEILWEKTTLFEDVIKNIENNKDIKEVVEEILVHGKRFEYHPMVHEKGLMYGIFRQEGNRIVVHNSIFETYIYTYLIGKREISQQVYVVSASDEKELSTPAELRLEKILLKFQEFMFEEFRGGNERFYESQARLIFLAYLKPILNGKGFYFVEPQTRENKRLDVVVIYSSRKYIIELKIWNGEKYAERGREQLKEYMDIQGLDEGYLLVFNFNKNKIKSADWLEIDRKKIFEVVV